MSALESSNNVFFIPDIQAVVTGGNIFSTRKSIDPIVKITGHEPFATWGDDNLYPQNHRDTIQKNDLIPAVLNKKADLIYSQGLVYGELVIDENGNDRLVRKSYPEINQWLKRTNINLYLREAAIDSCWYNHVFPQLILNAGRKVAYMYITDATMCRLSKQNKATGLIEKVYVNANWENGGKADDSDIIDAVDPYFDMAGQIVSGKSFRYILPLRDQVHGNVYYSRIPWIGIIESGWLDIAQAIPEFKKALMKNQITIKYHIRIAEWYWPGKYKDWDKMDNKERAKIMKDELDNFIKFMKGENAGGAFMSHQRWDKIANKEYPAWTIEPIKADNSSAAYIEDSREADFHIIRSLGFDPTLVGIGPGKGEASGSGSDKRVAFNQQILTCKSEQDRILKPLDVVASINGWHEKYGGTQKELHFWFKSYFLATLDQVTNEKRM